MPRLVCEEVLKFLLANSAVDDAAELKQLTLTARTRIASDLNSIKPPPETVLVNKDSILLNVSKLGLKRRVKKRWQIWDHGESPRGMVAPSTHLVSGLL